jgi:imidazolonepropionase-like amidohydrolase
MRLSPLFDSFYLLGSLWGSPPGSQVCTRNSSALPGATHAATMTAFVNVNVIPMDQERVLARHTVLVEGERITALGPSDKVKVPDGAVRIDGHGKYLIPGLADMHVDGMGDYDSAQLLSLLAGGTTALRPNNPVSRDQLQKLRQGQTAVEHLAPYFYLAGELDEFVQPGLSQDSVIAAYKAAGYNFIAGGGASTLLAAARRQGIALASHSHASHPGQLEALGKYNGSIDHLYALLSYGFLDSLDQGKTTRSVAELQALAAVTRRSGVWVTPTLDCMEYMSGRLSPQAVTIHRQLIKALQDSGVGLLLGAEGAPAYRELTALVQAGLTPYQALRTATYNPAQFLGQLDARGTIAVGKRADLVLLSGNPLQDIGHTREPAGVMHAGRWFDRAELDRRLLADPKAWAERVLRIAVLQHRKSLRSQLKTFEELTDSLALVPASEKDAYARLLGQLTAELGAMRAALPPEQHALFDPVARTWVREWRRQGYRLAIPGIALAP